MSDPKEEYTHALGLRRLTEQEKTIRLLKNTTCNNHKVRNVEKSRDRACRRVRPVNGMRPPLSPFFSDWKLTKKPKATRNFSSKSPRKRAEDNMNTLPVLAKSSPPPPQQQQQQSQNVLLLPKQSTSQQGVQIQPNIVIGQTIFQAPDGKKFILIPHSTSKPNPQGLVTVTKPHSQAQTLILPSTNNVKSQASKDSNTPQRFFYLPQGHSVVGTADIRSTDAPRAVTMGNVPCSNAVTSISPLQKLNIDGLSQERVSTPSTAQSSISPNIIHLLNMTKNVLNETHATVSVNLAKSQVTDVSHKLIPTGSLIPSSSVPLVPGSPLASRGSISLVPANSTVSAVSSTIHALSRPCNQTNQTLQVLKIKSSETSQSGVSITQSSQTPKCVYVTTNAISSANVATSETKSPILSLSVVPTGTSNQSLVDVPVVGANSSQIGFLSIVGSKMTNNASIASVFTPVSTTTASYEIKTVGPMFPVVTTQKVHENPLKILENSVISATDRQDGLACKITPEESAQCKNDEANNSNAMRTVDYKCESDLHLRNVETNCVVVLGKKRKKTHGFKGSNTVLHRRYGGPPFMPCKAPPSPNTPSSSTCCLYEHTLLKMATRGFWGCEMGKLQDVFRSIRCESIDQDTVEDVTKRCYDFVKTRLLQAEGDCKSMYRYMKNYIDEFDSFLDRVYPVAIIAMLIYLPTAADYSLVTWHGIPPTGWSEYRRAVVMREVFEVIYRFWNELGTVPDYEKRFFDSPVKSSLLVPRVLDLRQSYSDPTTCVVQKVPHGDRLGSGSNSKDPVCDTKSYIQGSKLSNKDQEPKYDRVSRNTTPTQEIDGKEDHWSERPCKVESLNKPKLHSIELDLPVSEEDTVAAKSRENQCSKVNEPLKPCKNSTDELAVVDDLLMTVRPRIIQPEPLDFLYPNNVDVSSQANGKFSELQSDMFCGRESENLPNTTDMNDTNAVGKCVVLSDQPVEGGTLDHRSSDQNNAEPVRLEKIIPKADSDHSSRDYDAREAMNPNAVYSINRIDSVDNKHVMDINEDIMRQSKERKIISARFAESIAAACGNNSCWNESSEKQDHGDVFTQGIKDRAGSIFPITKATNAASMVAPMGIDTTGTVAPIITIPLREKSEISTLAYSKLSNVSEMRENCSNVESFRDCESAMQRRRTPRRLASSTRFDFLVANDDVSLERDLRKAIKLSKLESNATSKANEVIEEEADLVDKSNDFKKSERPPLKTSLKYLNIVPHKEHGDNATDCPINELKKLKRSVAFEALWTQKSVEEPTVIQDEKIYSLGEFLEKFPIETYCPAKKAIIRICNEDYNAREILGYLRRGTQLVEQVGNDVVIDTTRTVKSNSTILAVRKVPPGKISKLIHPDLHLETYTSHLLPLGIKQPLKGRKGLGRSTKMKRKSSISKEDITIKSEPQSPSVGNSQLDLNGFEDSVIGPPPEKTVKLESPVTEGIKTNKSGFGVTVEVQTNNEKDCKETQTVDQNGNFFTGLTSLSSVTNVDSLEGTLSTILEAALAGISESSVSSSNPSRDIFDDLIKSYERAGNFLLNTAKMLNKVKLKTLDNCGSK